MEQLITIVGPTAVGKTDATLFLAEKLRAPIISGDAYQVYRGLNIGSAKPSNEELKAFHHDLIDIRSPFESYHVADFQREASTLIREYNRQGIIPILSGGTGLYIQSLLEGYTFSDASRDMALRKELDLIYMEKGIDGLREYAMKLADTHGITLPFLDKHRLFRAIELLQAGDLATLLEPVKRGLLYKGPIIGLMRDRSDLYERINHRVDLMVQAGLFEEVKKLYELGLRETHSSMKGIGYKEVIAYYEGAISKEEAIQLIKKNTRHFAKRQLTWYKRMPYIQWIFIQKEMKKWEIEQEILQLVESDRYDD